MLDKALRRNAHHSVVVHAHHRLAGDPEIRQGISGMTESLAVEITGVEPAWSDLRTLSLLLMQQINYGGLVCKKGCYIAPDVLYLPQWGSSKVSFPSSVRQNSTKDELQRQGWVVGR